jgi:hypothetical protein
MLDIRVVESAAELCPIGFVDDLAQEVKMSVAALDRDETDFCGLAEFAKPERRARALREDECLVSSKGSDRPSSSWAKAHLGCARKS